MKINRHDFLLFSCLAGYLLGGALVFSGLGLILFFDDLDLLGWGQGHAMGYLGVCIGLGMNIVAVLGMRLMRNHLPSCKVQGD